jgi:RHS repeat-associated protein
MKLSRLGKVALLACLCAFNANALSNPLNEYQVYEKDVDSDGDIDYLLKLSPEDIEIPYDINLQVERSAQQYLLTKNPDGSFTVSKALLNSASWQLINADINEINYLVGGELEIAIRTYGSDSQVIIASQVASGSLAEINSLEVQSIGYGVVTSIADVNGDGLEEVVFSGSGINTLGSASASMQHDSVQNLKFNTSVGADGSAQAHLPIWLPKGSGPTPSINISYSSNRGNGPLGLGTHLSGSSKIHYCRPTADVKGTMAAAPFTAEEDLCLDGQHLVLLSGSHTSVGSQYILENNAQVKIIKQTGQFEMLLKGGGKRVFALNRDNKAWYLTRAEDEFENGYDLTYKYYGDTTDLNRKPLLEKITYDDVIVDFSWQARSENDVIVQHKGGRTTVLSDRLTSISIARDGSALKLKSYGFSYGSEESNQDSRSILKKVAVCSDAESCVVASCDSNSACVSSSVNWNVGAKLFSTPKAIKSFPNKDPNQKAHYLDINGDGYTDIMYPSVNAGNWKYHLGTENGFGGMEDTGIAAGSGDLASLATPISLGADHMSGLIVARSSLDAGKGLYACVDADNEDQFLLYRNASDRGMHDQTHDGVWHCDPDKYTPWHKMYFDHGGRHKILTYIEYYMLLPDMNGGTLSGFTLEGSSDHEGEPLFFTLGNKPSVLDLNSDGLQDIYVEYEPELKRVHDVIEDNSTTKFANIASIYMSKIVDVSESESTVGFVRLELDSGLTVSRGVYNDHIYSQGIFSDFNGDGLPDIEKCPKNNMSISCRRFITSFDHEMFKTAQDGARDVYTVSSVTASNPNRFKKTVNGHVFTSPKYYPDLNGDGLADTVWAANDGVYIEINKGGSSHASLYVKHAITAVPSDGFNLRFMDYDADGLTDIMFDVNGSFKLFKASYTVDQTVESGTPLGFTLAYTEESVFTFTGSIFKRLKYGGMMQAGIVDKDGATYNTFSRKILQYQDAPTTFDYNHDGMQDLIYFKEGSSSLYATSLTAASLNVGKLQSVSDSFGNTTNYTYKTTKQAPVTEFYQTRFPYKNVANSAMVVDTMSFNSDALPLAVTTRYEYHGALYHMQGRGYLGFTRRNVIDENRNLKTEEIYNQAYPLTGTLKSSKTYSTLDTSKLINQIDNVWNYKTVSNLNAQIKVPYLAESTLKEYAVPGSLTKSTHAVNTFDNFSNLLTRTQTVSDTSGIQLTQSIAAHYSHVNSSESYNNTKIDDWDIGFRTQLSVTSTLGSFSDTRTTNWSRYQNGSGDTNLVGTLTENGLISTFEYTNSGKLASKSISSAGSETHAITTRTEFTNANFLNNYLPQTITNATGHSASIEYHPKWHQLKKQTDVYGLSTSYEYDDNGQLISSHGPDGAVNISTSQYCSNVSSCPTSAYYRSTVMQIHNAQKGFLAPPQYSYFDKLGRVVREETLNANNETVYQDYNYDALSRISQASLPYLSTNQSPKWISYNSYDLYDRPVIVKYDNGNQGQVAYARTVSNNQMQVTRTVTNVIPGQASETQTDITRYDALGQIAYVKNNESALENFYSYDGQGNMRKVEVKNAGSLLKTVTATFNSAGFKTQINDPDTGTYNYEYDPLGLMRKQSDARGYSYEFTYDKLNNQTQSKLNGQMDATWVYSESQPGLLLERFKDGFKESYQYDDLLRTTQVDTRLKSLATRQFKYEYDSAGRLDTAHYPSGFSVQAKYNGLGYLTAYNNPKNNHSYWQAETMDAFGNWVGERFGNNIQTAKSYDAASGLLKTITSQKTNDGDIQDLAYTWDSSGNLRTRTDNALMATETFSYDQSNRLTQAATTGLVSGPRTLNYGYDALGNLHFKSDLVSGSAHSIDNKLVYGDTNSGPSRLQSVIKDGSEILAYNYDANGNMTQRGITNLTYTAANKPNHIWKTVNANRVDSFFDYDTSEQRYYQATQNNYETTQEMYYYGAGYEEIFDTDLQTGIKIHKQKAYVGGVMIHTYTQSDDPIFVAESKGGKFADIQYLHHDHLGSTQTITDGAGGVLQNLAFDPFGKARQSNWENLSSANPPIEGNPDWAAISLNNTSTGFTGHEMLADFDLIHMGGRLYDPNVGRMMSADPYIQAPYFGQSFNRYSYVWNNPLSMTDPSGYCAMGMTIYGNGSFFSWEVACPDSDVSDTDMFGGQGSGNGSGDYVGIAGGDGSEFTDDYAQNGGTSVGGATGVISSNSSYTDSNGSMHVSAGFTISSISSGGSGSAPVSPPELFSRLDSAQFAADLLATSEIPFVSQVAGAANALTYAVRGQWGMAGSSLAGMIPGFGAGADIARMGMWASKGMGKAKDTLKTLGKTCCFVAGTLVLTSNGHANIEDLEVGDQVLAQNTATGERAYNPIP